MLADGGVEGGGGAYSLDIQNPVLHYASIYPVILEDNFLKFHLFFTATRKLGYDESSST